MKVFMVATPTVRDPSPEMMVAVNDCYFARFHVNTEAQMLMVIKDT